MPDNRTLQVGGGDDYLLAAGCPVASQKFGHGGYMSHRGDPESFLVAEARVRDGSASVRVAVWRCVFCGKTVVGLGDPAEPVGAQDYTWLEKA